MTFLYNASCGCILSLYILFFYYQVSSFDEATKVVNNLNSTPSNDELLALYGNFKQATVVRLFYKLHVLWLYCDFFFTNFLCVFILFYLFNSITFFSQGDVQGDQPWAVQVQARAKWDSWNSKKGTSKEDAEAAYIKTANELIAKYGLKN